MAKPGKPGLRIQSVAFALTQSRGNSDAYIPKIVDLGENKPR